MRSLFEQILEALDAERRFALATVVQTSGSTPQKTGARALFFADGQIAGTLGGGCMEAEARRRALLALRSGSPFEFALQLDQDFGWDDGLICGGSASILIDPAPEKSRTAIRALLDAIGRGERAVLATIVAGPRPGETHLFPSSEPPPGPLCDPSVGDAVSLLLDAPWDQPRTVATPTAKVYLEAHYPLPELLIVGGGHVGSALAAAAARLDFRITVLDDRAPLLNHDRFPPGAEIVVDEIVSGLSGRAIGRDTYVVIVTRGHQHDAHALREVVASGAAYVGMIGSRRKVHVIFQGLLEEGLATPGQLRRVRAPIGLDIGARTVDEIAVSIAAELVAVRARIRAGADPNALTVEGESHAPMAAKRSPKSTALPDESA